MHSKKMLCQRRQESEPNFHSDLWEVNNDVTFMIYSAPMVIVQWGPKIEKLGTWKKMETKYRPNGDQCLQNGH